MVFFYDNASSTLHQASTFNMDARVRKSAIQLQDRVLLAKLSAGDLISQEVVYHSKLPGNNVQQSLELVAYIEETRAESIDTIPVFKLAELTQMYST